MSSTISGLLHNVHKVALVGPAVVIGRDGKQFIMKDGGNIVRVYVCRLTKLLVIPATSQI